MPSGIRIARRKIVPNFDTFIENLHKYVQSTVNLSSRRHGDFQDSLGDSASRKAKLGDMQNAFLAGHSRQAASGLHSDATTAKADPS